MFRTYDELLLWAAERSQWSSVHELEAAIETAFDGIAIDLSEFGDDESLTPAPYGLTEVSR